MALPLLELVTRLAEPASGGASGRARQVTELHSVAQRKFVAVEAALAGTNARVEARLSALASRVSAEGPKLVTRAMERPGVLGALRDELHPLGGRVASLGAALERLQRAAGPGLPHG